jgi:hypothetical protein
VHRQKSFLLVLRGDLARRPGSSGCRDRNVAIGIASWVRVGTIALQECDRRAAGARRRSRTAEFGRMHQRRAQRRRPLGAAPFTRLQQRAVRSDRIESSSGSAFGGPVVTCRRRFAEAAEMHHEHAAARSRDRGCFRLGGRSWLARRTLLLSARACLPVVRVQLTGAELRRPHWRTRCPRRLFHKLWRVGVCGVWPARSGRGEGLRAVIRSGPCPESSSATRTDLYETASAQGRCPPAAAFRPALPATQGRCPRWQLPCCVANAGARRRLWNAPGRVPMQASALMRTSGRTRRLFAGSGREPSISADVCRFGA